ncbi:hypothetical protein LTR53_016222 [Teratosphaeriaceae sp. CCFEE 6253]|nr:hypothetical protein LTR53_016222 [Teratosphaeriaceae sp. CCFEE 6253]
MAHSAKSRLLNELSRSRISSPNADEFETAGSFDIRNEQLLHSTVNMDSITDQLPIRNDEQASYAGSDVGSGSAGSTEMSIELGRGVKRATRDHDADVSSNIALNFGGDSQYDFTPPARPRNPSRKSDDLLRRQASVRNATEAAKGNDSMRRRSTTAKQRNVSETLKLNAESDASLNAEDFAQATSTFNARNTRFTRSRQTSMAEPLAPPPSRFASAQTQDGTPRRQAIQNPTVQSATYTSNSFALPDLPNITELVSGVRKDGTPVFSRVSSKPRSRFTSAGNYRAPSLPEHAPIMSVPIPDEEKAIFASLELLKDRVSGLEMEKAEAEKRAEEYEAEVIDLRSQLQAKRRRPDSALGSDDGDRAAEKARMEKTRLQASLKVAQDRLDRAEGKISVSEIAVKGVAKERDDLVTQIGVAYFNNEELKAENEELRGQYESAEAEREHLREEVERLKMERKALKGQVAQSKAQIPDIRDRSPERSAPALRSRKETKPSSGKERVVDRATSERVEQTHEDIASRISREVQKHRSEAVAARMRERDAAREGQDNRPRSKSRQRRASAGLQRRASSSKRTVSAPEADLSEPESTGQEITQKTRETLKDMYLPSPKKVVGRREDTRDITVLSDFPSLHMADLRRKIEEELMAEKAAKKQQQRNASAPETRREEEQARSSMPRKSSLKDLNADLENGTGRFSLGGVDDVVKIAKSVRVQSPHTSDASLLPPQQEDAGDVSMLSNISRRRRRTASQEGMTSAFMLPDITLHGSQPFPTITGMSAEKSCIAHVASGCTACHPTLDMSIPTPIPVTDRDAPQDLDFTSATIRPAQSPPIALATVIKTLSDEITHLKLQLHAHQRRYHAHDPALSKRQRLSTKVKVERLTAEVERRSDQVYALYDVLEGQKQQQAGVGEAEEGAPSEVEGLEETLLSIGIDPAELSGRVGRSAPLGLDGAADDMSEASQELPWEGLSDYESEEEMAVEGLKRRSAAL